MFESIYYVQNWKKNIKIKVASLKLKSTVLTKKTIIFDNV